MKIKLLIATNDSDYVEHLSRILSENYSDSFEVAVCSSQERLQDLVSGKKINVLLLEPSFLSFVDLSMVNLPIFLWSDSEDINDKYSDLKKIYKYQRISLIAGSILENYSKISNQNNLHGSEKAKITAIWSPCGGVGKTAVALAYATRKVLDNKHVTYLNLENFSSISTYFPDKGKSISSAFEKLETNLPMFITGIRQQDSSSGITYFSSPKNYDDINVLTADDIKTLIDACASTTDELVVDLSSQCDKKTQKIFELSDTVMLVSDTSENSKAKLKQFITQHSIAQMIQSKSYLINNKGAKNIEIGINRTIDLPLVQSKDPISIYKTLSGVKF